jgi:glycosyltransferase involved in cell wall biosynthesis
MTTGLDLPLLVFDVTPFYWTHPSGISFHIWNLLAHLPAGILDRAVGLNFSLNRRPTTPESPIKVIHLGVPGRLGRMHPLLDRQVPPAELTPGSLFIATAHYIPAWAQFSLYLIYDCIKLKYPGEMRVDRERVFKTMSTLIQRADLIGYISSSTRADILSWFDTNKPMIYMPPSIDIDTSESTTANIVDLRLPRQFIYSCGVVQHRKRFDWLFRFVDERPELGLEVVLSGAIDNFGKYLLREYRARYPRASVRHLGLLPRRVQAGVYRQSTVFAFPSVYEGFGMPVVEAMACGALVISAMNGGIADILPDGDVQLMEEDSYEAFQVGLLRILESEPHQRADLRRLNLVRASRFAASAVSAEVGAQLFACINGPSFTTMARTRV